MKKPARTVYSSSERTTLFSQLSRAKVCPHGVRWILSLHADRVRHLTPFVCVLCSSHCHLLRCQSTRRTSSVLIRPEKSKSITSVCVSSVLASPFACPPFPEILIILIEHLCSVKNLVSRESTVDIAGNLCIRRIHCQQREVWLCALAERVAAYSDRKRRPLSSVIN